MYPSILSQQIEQGLKDFLATMFHVANPFFHGLIQRFLDTDGNLNKGPYVSLQLPFEKGSDHEFFPQVPLGFPPYRHQELAFNRLAAPDPRPTLIATGTGSGKTECFLQPILDYCRQTADQPGIKAILLYPMNALAYDQATRLAATIWKTPALHTNVTAGLYVGQHSAEPCGTMSRESIITDTAILRQSPPHILLTNYKMLDYLLVRARDAQLWAANDPETLKFVVVDELHTFDGAQGTDLACLLRRLKARLGTPSNHLCPVGTSATLGGESSQNQLTRYAEQIFGEPFGPEAVINEYRQSAETFLRSHLISTFTVPGPEECAALDPDNYASRSAFLTQQIALWTGLDVDPEDAAPAWRIQLGAALKNHVFVHNLLRVVDGRVRSLQHIIQELAEASPQLKHGDATYAHLLLNSLLACISAAKSASGTAPFLHIRVQQWYRELRRMVCAVQSPPELRFYDDLTEEQRRFHLPLLHCRECGQTGWLGRLPLHGEHLQTDVKPIYIDYFSKKPSGRLRTLFPEEHGQSQGEFPGSKLGVCPHCLRLSRQTSGPCATCGQDGIIPVLVPEVTEHHCPSCGAHNSLTLVGSRSASLTSTMIGQLMSSPYNSDPKCIAFSDNVQDAAHRAGFFAARTFRFTFRSALQHYIQDYGEGQNLPQVAREMPAHWRSRMSSEVFAATFLPPNMAWRQEAEHLQRHDQLPRNSTLCKHISQRLELETVLEFGLSSRIGRTLEKSGASVVRPAPDRLQAAAEALAEQLPNELGELQGRSLEGLSAFLLGLLTQMRMSGGIYNPAFGSYITQWGNPFLLSQKHTPWMPNFGPKTPTPDFVTTRNGVSRFSCLTRSHGRPSWFEWWAYLHFPELALRRPSLAQRFYQCVFPALERHGLIEDRFQDGHHIYGLIPDHLLLTTQATQYQCHLCGHMVSGAREDDVLWQDMACLRRGCSGNYAPAREGQDYYGRLYSRGKITRLVAQEHTGLLDRDTRENLEQRFKADDADRKPWYPNLLSSTPTLEMGIDIGDLSTTLQCSVPPTQANYIQRVGRSGRKHGNGLNLTVAAGKAHDLYFFAEPLEMIAGDVHPPGVFLDASAVLERQCTAFCFDCWIQTMTGDDDPVPGQLGRVLDTFHHDDPTIFPHNFTAFVHGNQADLLQAFERLFETELSPDSKNHLQTFIYGDSEDTPGLTYRIVARLYELRQERRSLKTQVDRLYREIKRREKSPARDQNFEQEMDELRQERQGLMALIRDINAKNTYNFFTDEGLLPNYAFPEQGIQLKSVIYRKRSTPQQGQGRFESFSFEYERPAQSGLREFAPGNTFYAEGRRVQIDRIDLKQADVATWRLCANCPHSEPEASAKNHTVCPRCGSTLWNDQGRKQELVRLRQVMATTPDWKSRISDDADERDPQFYTTQLLVDVDPSSIQDAYQIENPQCPFGFEFISKATFRDINFGPQGGNGHALQVAGEEIERPGFVLCRHCGKVQKGNGGIEHAYGCPARNKDDGANFIQSVFLYREFTSEAIKILVPVSGFEASRERLDSFVAALQLGLRHHFGGSAYAIDHLQTTLSQEPVPDSSLRKQYLVLFDTVPGGTGFLQQLMRSETMLTVLDKALTALTECACQKDPARDGCYACLFAYRNSYSMPTTSRRTAMEVLTAILDQRETLRQVPNLDNLRVDGLGESELEMLFLKALQGLGRRGWTVEMRKALVRAKPGRFLRLGNWAYEIEPQVSLGHAEQVRIPSRADYVLWPARSSQGHKPIAIFTDGLNFHRTRIGQDTAQRMALLKSDALYVWSLSWKDVHSEVKQARDRVADLLHPGAGHMGQQQFAALLDKLGIQSCKQWHYLDSFQLLAEHLTNPDEAVMQRYALALAMTLLDMSASNDAPRRETWLRDVEAIAPDIVARELRAQLTEGIIGYLQAGAVQMAVFAARTALQHSNPNGVRIILWLDDGENAQEDSTFERSWINFLRLLNIFQFLPGTVAVTREGLRQGLYDELLDTLSDTATTAGQPENEATPDAAVWREAFELADPAVHPILEAWQQRGEAPPEVGFDLQVGTRVVAEAELAWPQRQTAYLWPGQEESFPELQQQGWTLHVIGNAEEHATHS